MLFGYRPTKEIKMLKKFVYTSAILLSTVLTPAFAQNAITEFNEAWENSSNTHYEAPPADINASLLLQTNENVKNLQLTGAQLWDAEKNKAWDPKTYILPTL
jgi:hypothetical protein